MRKLLRANFSSLMKDKLFGILMTAELFVGGLFPIAFFNISRASCASLNSFLSLSFSFAASLS